MNSAQKRTGEKSSVNQTQTFPGEHHVGTVQFASGIKYRVAIWHNHQHWCVHYYEDEQLLGNDDAENKDDALREANKLFALCIKHGADARPRKNSAQKRAGFNMVVKTCADCGKNVISPRGQEDARDLP